MTAEGLINKIKIKLGICEAYVIIAIRMVQHAQPTKEKVLTCLQKIDKELQVDIFTRNTLELKNTQTPCLSTSVGND